jgi:hypothetical protein
MEGFDTNTTVTKPDTDLSVDYSASTRKFAALFDSLASNELSHLWVYGQYQFRSIYCIQSGLIICHCLSESIFISYLTMLARLPEFQRTVYLQTVGRRW